MCHLLRLYKAVCTVMASNWMPSSHLPREPHRYFSRSGGSEKSNSVSSHSLCNDSGSSPLPLRGDSKKSGSVCSISQGNGSNNSSSLSLRLPADDSEETGSVYPLRISGSSRDHPQEDPECVSFLFKGSELEATMCSTSQPLCALETTPLDKRHVQRNFRIRHQTRQFKLHCPSLTCEHHTGEGFKREEELEGHVRHKHPLLSFAQHMTGDLSSQLAIEVI
jgi:hypothetical protein